MPRVNEIGELRRSAVVAHSGPGAIVDFRADDASISIVAAGLEEWDRRAAPSGISNPQSIFEPRLQTQLNVDGFRQAPVYPQQKDESRSLVGVRFPRWLQCRVCHVVKPAGKWQREPGKPWRVCGTCTAKAPGKRRVHAVPVRFVVACDHGHLDDFPWDFWVGHKAGCSRSKPLVLKAEGAGLAGLMLRCMTCESSRSMDGIFSRRALAGLKCSGRRPWLATAPEDCKTTDPPRVLQRGASNLYFPVIRSALSIPPWSDRVQGLLGQYWAPICNVSAEQRGQFIRVLYPSLDLTSISVDDLVRMIEQRIQVLESSAGADLRWEEYLQFTAGGRTPAHERGEFEIRTQVVPENAKPHVGSLVQVVRLREVRAISGFTRIRPPSGGADEGAHVAPIQLGKLRWLPAIEVRGEGVFLSLDPERVRAWEEVQAVRARADELDAVNRTLWAERFGSDAEPPRRVTSRFLLVHTLAHALIRQLALDCGYSSTSLRERLYVGDGPHAMCGLLIYTATSDADGTLGGLVRQGAPARTGDILRRAIQDASWCSSDPLCITGISSAPESINKAACHCCVLTSETSCEEYNSYLDRWMLVDSTFGYFRDFAAAEAGSG